MHAPRRRTPGQDPELTGVRGQQVLIKIPPSIFEELIITVNLQQLCKFSAAGM